MKKYFIKNKKRGPVPYEAGGFRSGFTLVETLVGLAIFTVAILALMSVLGSSISNTTYAKQKMIASYLGQEGIEYIRNMRDTYVLYDAGGGAAGWTKFTTNILSKCSGAFTTCYFDDAKLTNGGISDMNDQPVTKIDITSCVGAPCPFMKYDSATGKYGYASGTNSIFYRQITVETVPPNTPSADEIKVTSEVFWNQGSKSYNVKFQEYLYNWVE